MPASVLQPIETLYGHHRFRSRLEARWAVVFDALGLAYEYEAEGYVLPNGSRYLPDFWLTQVQVFAEVKPADFLTHVSEIGVLDKAIGLVMGSQRPLLILDGPPRDVNYWAMWPDHLDPCGWEWHDVILTDTHRYHETDGRLFTCSGARWPERIEEPDPIHPAILAGTRARFEHGARG